MPRTVNQYTEITKIYLQLVFNTRNNETAAAAPKIQLYNKPCRLQHGETKLGSETASGVARIMNATTKLQF